MAISRERFCLNRIIYPSLDLENFFKLARDMGLSAAELRNDLPGGHILDDLSTNQVRALADKYQIRILTINAIQKFNLGVILDHVVSDVKEMVQTARSIGCEAIVLCPNNDIQDGRTASQFYQDTVAALKRITPILEKAGIRGFVEPLGFKECSLRSKDRAIQAIQESGSSVYGIVHDTFHHFLGPDEKVFPAETGIVHISGVEGDMDPTRFRDEHRILIGPRDVMGNQAQINALESQGYDGFYSFEPFGSEVQEMSLEDFSISLEESLKLLQSLA
jgi:2-keto-myo-inositol isomerase